ncbi:UNVERIFIED_CONTAM: 7-deoxyloganic acid hydroxylase [Sesamum calycinum]|uniref:7-deoxyloganic acid hydroxylase n=1 Tax=Sesamum calycinum TaxID=2727403 RepID=A0AAW2QYP2_9LAMI
MNEVLRLYPPVVELSRLVEEETKLGEYTIPADTLLMLLIVILHRDPEYWGETIANGPPDVLKATRAQHFPWVGSAHLHRSELLLAGGQACSLQHSPHVLL